MTNLTKRTTVYLEQELHRALRMKSAVTDRSVSDLINEMVRERLVEDANDLNAFHDRAEEPEISYEGLLQELKAHGKI
jgi:hypothetical protein